MSIKGVDVSTWQGDINWNLVKNDGIEFAIIRTGYGREGDNQIDDKFYQNIKNAKDAGLKVGAYHYSYAEDEEDAKKEAEFCLSIIKDAKTSLDLPIYFDIEDNSIANKHNISIKTQMCINFCTAIENAGYWAGVYANLNWFENYLNKDELAKRYTIWLAQYNSTQDMYADIWQYTSSGTINGINGNVDINLMHRDLPSEINGISSKSSSNTTSQNSTCGTINYTVQAGDTLADIGIKYGINYQTISKLNGIKDPNLIYVGQIIKIPINEKSLNNITTYTVQSGDTLICIANKYGTTYQSIANYNNIENPNLIYPGQILKICKH